MIRFRAGARFAAICSVLLAAPLFADSYIVPDDATFIAGAPAIVTGTVLSSRVQMGPFGIETVATVSVEEVLKGAFVDQQIEIYEPGGTLGNLTHVIPGSPRFQDGEHVLLMLRQRGDGQWACSDFALGRFSFTTDDRGQQILARVFGDIDYPHADSFSGSLTRRQASQFLDFIRASVRGENPAANYLVRSNGPVEPRAIADAGVPAGMRPIGLTTYTAASYTVGATRRCASSDTGCCSGTTDCASKAAQRFPLSYVTVTGNTEPGAAGSPAGSTAIDKAMSAWSNINGTTIAISRGGTVSSDSGLQSFDNHNSVQFERDLLAEYGIAHFTCSGSSYSGTLGLGGYFSSGSHTGPNGETFFTLVEGDVEMNQGIANCTLLLSTNSGDWNTAVAHEVGHSIGWRHSDQNTADTGACDSGSEECATVAIMHSFVVGSDHVNAIPQAWDIHAAQAVYPGAVTCNAVGITTQPQNVSINTGTTTVLTVTASGTSPFTYQWYQGTKGTTTTPVGTNSSSFTTPTLTTTTQYWVRIGGCNSSTIDSDTATVTVTCTTTINTQPVNASIASGAQTTLHVSASGAPLSYQWYQGTSGDTSTPVGTNSPSFTTPALTTTTSYWVQVTGCSGPVNSNTATVTVAACFTHINQQPQSQTINPGQQVQLSVNATGAPLTYQWYIGLSGNTTTPVAGATSNAVIVSPTTTTSYWVQVTGCSGPLNSNTAIVTVQAACATNISVQPQSTTISSGQQAQLSVTASGGNSVSYQWYTGTAPDTSSPILGATSSSVSVSPTVTTSYWVRVIGCSGAVNSVTATVTVQATCATTISAQPQGTTISAGQQAQLSVTATGGTTVTYQWYTGTVPDTSNPILGATSSSVSVSPTVTTSYWVQVTGCSGAVNSATAVVTVTGTCVIPSITTPPAGVAITPGSSTQLSVVATGTAPLSYQWYTGVSGDTTNQVPGATSATINVNPTTTTSYWVRAINSCGSADSAAAVVTVGNCSSPSIIQPGNVTVTTLSPATLTVSATSSTTAHYQWYQGTTGDLSHPAGTDSSTYQTPPIETTSQFWVKVTNSCGSASSSTITVSVVPGRHRSGRH